MRRSDYNHGLLPVHAHLTGDGWESTGLSYDDYSGMSLTKRKLPVDRRLPTPDWAMNDSKLRDVVFRFRELRAGFKRPRSGTPEERLARENKQRLPRKPHLTEIISKLAREYVAVKKAGDDPARLKLLGIEIE